MALSWEMIMSAAYQGLVTAPAGAPLGWRRDAEAFEKAKV